MGSWNWAVWVGGMGQAFFVEPAIRAEIDQFHGCFLFSPPPESSGTEAVLHCTVYTVHSVHSELLHLPQPRAEIDQFHGCFLFSPPSESSGTEAVH